MTRAELIERIAAKQPQLPLKDVELAVRCILEQMSQVLATGSKFDPSEGILLAKTGHREAGGKLFSDSLARLSFWMFLLVSVPVGFHHQFIQVPSVCSTAERSVE